MSREVVVVAAISFVKVSEFVAERVKEFELVEFVVIVMVAPASQVFVTLRLFVPV